MPGYLFPRRGLGLALLAILIIALSAHGPGVVGSSALATYTFSGTVYVGLDAPVGLPGVSLALWGSGSDASLGTQLDTTVSSSGRSLGAFSVSTVSGTVYRFYHIVLTPLPGYAPLRATAGAGGAAVSATWIRFVAPSAGDHLGNGFYLQALDTPTPTPVPTRTPTVTLTHTRPPTLTRTPTPTMTLTRTRPPTLTRTPMPTSSPTRSPTPTSGPQSLELCAGADADLSEWSPATNYGASTVLVLAHLAGSGPNNSRALFRFTWPDIPAGTVVQSASLRLRLVSAGGDAAAQIAVYPITADWQEGVVTWANQPGVTQGSMGQSNIGATFPTVVSWDVTALVQQWFDGTRPNLGLELRGPEAGAWQRNFDSREAPGGYCPRLVLILHASQPIATLTPSHTPTRTPTRTPGPTATPTISCFPEFLVGSSFADATSFNRLNTGTSFQEYICPPGDLDWFKFPVLVGQFISVRVDDVPNHYHAILYRPDGSEAWDSAENPSTEEVISWTAEQSGDWRVRVSGSTSGDWSNTVSYGLWVNVCPGPDESSWGVPQPLGLITSGYICPSGDEDTYTVDVPQAQALSMTVRLYNLPADYDLYVYDPAGVLRRASTGAGTVDEIAVVVADNAPGLWKVQVRPKGAADQSATQPYWLSANIETNLDLTVNWIEVTQVTQTYLQNDVDLVVGKPTLARVYVGTGDALGPIEGVSVELYGYADCLGCTPLPGSPLNLGPRSVTRQTTWAQRLNAAGFEAFLPDAWQNAGPLYLRAHVYAPPQQPEVTQSNNTGGTLAHFVTRAPVHLLLVPVTAGGLTPSLSNNPPLDNIISFMRDSYPTSDIALWLALPSQGVLADYDYTVQGSSGCGPSWTKLLADLAYYHVHTIGPPPGFVLYGILDPGVPHYWAGCGSYDVRVSAGILNTGADNLAHEAGHMLGLPHAPCGNPFPQNPDPAFPVYHNPLGGDFPAASIGEVGVRLNGSLAIYNPAKTYDIMSYCGPKWFTPYNYNKLMGAIPAGAVQLAAESASSPHLIAIGQVQAGNILLPRPLWVQPMPDSPAQAGEGPYRIEVQSATGAVLASRAFDPRDPYHGGDANTGLFAEVLPYPAGAARVLFTRAGQTLTTVSPSAHAPAVTLIYPNGGEIWSSTGTYTVTWQTHDADADPLYSSLFYSRDNGATYNPIAVNLTGTLYALDVAQLPGGTQALFRVDVSDGLLTSGDTSDAPLRVPNKAPLVIVLGPAPDSLLAPGETALLSALATDAEDGPLSPAGLSWSSDRDGPLGTGGDLAVRSLSAGWHTLTVSVGDSAGARGEASVRVLVGQRLWLPLALKMG